MNIITSVSLVNIISKQITYRCIVEHLLKLFIIFLSYDIPESPLKNCQIVKHN